MTPLEKVIEDNKKLKAALTDLMLYVRSQYGEIYDMHTEQKTEIDIRSYLPDCLTNCERTLDSIEEN